MSNWRKFNAELARRNAAARAFEPSIENEEANLARRAKEAQNYINRSWNRNRQAEWAAKSSEEKGEHYRDSFFLTMIDDTLYLQSGEDGALTDYNGTFIGYTSADGIAYADTPDEPYEDTHVWKQNEYGQYFIIHNYRNVEDEILEAEEMNPGVVWGEPRISEEVQEKINAAMREQEERAELAEKKKAILAEEKKAILKAVKKQNMKKVLVSSKNDESNLEGLLGGGRRRRITRRKRVRRSRRSKH